MLTKPLWGASSRKPGLKLVLYHDKTAADEGAHHTRVHKPSGDFGMGFGWERAVVLVAQTRENQQLELKIVPESKFDHISSAIGRTLQIFTFFQDLARTSKDSMVTWLAHLKIFQESNDKYRMPHDIFSVEKKIILGIQETILLSATLVGLASLAFVFFGKTRFFQPSLDKTDCSQYQISVPP